MNLSVVIRSKDEADRLRLVLASLTAQDGLSEVVVVDDGSSDHTPEVLAEAAAILPLVVVRHASARGRSAASNAGARVARGDILLFLDGDTLAGPGLVQRHLAAHATQGGLVARGECRHLRCTRFLKDPETASSRAGEEARIARLSPAEIDRMRVTLRQVESDFAAIEGRAEAGTYPGAAPRHLQELEMAALREHPDCTVLWAAASGGNQSVERQRFLDAGGFDERMDINEHRELAFRLCAGGARMTAVDDAPSYHLTHRTGWRDPLETLDWERIFYGAHPTPAIGLLAVFWASLSPNPKLPSNARINSLPELEAAARGETGIDYDAVRRDLGLPALARSPAARRSA